MYPCFSLFQAPVCKFWLSRFGENIQLIAIIDTRPVNWPIFYGNFEGNKSALLAKIFWFSVSLVPFLYFNPSL